MDLLKKVVRFIRKKYLMQSKKLRTFFYSLLFSSFGEGSYVLGKINVITPENISIGNFVSININCLLNAREQIVIGDHVHLSPGVFINTGGLDYAKKREERIHLQEKVIIEDGVWIGSGAIINPGVTIGENSVVGAGAVVTRNVPSNVVVAGVPAQVIKSIS